MAFSDPQTVTINAVPHTLARVNGTAPGVGTFQKDDNTVRLTVSDTYNKRTRRALQLTSSKIAADPLISGVNLRLDFKCTIVVDEPAVGYTRAEAKQIVDGLLAYLTASSGAKVTQLLAGEN